MQKEELYTHIIGILGHDVYMKYWSEVHKLVDRMFRNGSGLNGRESDNPRKLNCVSTPQRKRTRRNFTDQEKYILDNILGMMMSDRNGEGSEASVIVLTCGLDIRSDESSGTHQHTRSVETSTSKDRLDSTIKNRINSFFRDLGYSNYDEGSDRIPNYIENCKKKYGDTKWIDETTHRDNDSCSSRVSSIETIVRSPTISTSEYSHIMPHNDLSPTSSSVTMEMDDVSRLGMQNCDSNKVGPCENDPVSPLSPFYGDDPVRSGSSSSSSRTSVHNYHLQPSKSYSNELNPLFPKAIQTNKS